MIFFFIVNIKKIAMSSNIWKCIQTGRTFTLLSFLCFSHLALVLGDSETEAAAELLHRHIRDVKVRVVSAPNSVPENVSNEVTLYNVSLIAPNRNYIVTNSSAGVNSMFQVTNGLLRLRSTLPADQRKLFDYEKFKIFDVTINCTNQTDPTDVVIVTVRIALSDVNDEPPVFTNKPNLFLATVVANPTPGTVVFTVTVADPDTNANIVFGIGQVTYQEQTFTERFQFKLLAGGAAAQKTYNIITAGTGALTQGAEYNIKIVAQDLNTAEGQQLINGNIYVLVGNRQPQFFEQSYKGRIYENTQTTGVLEMDSDSKLLIRAKQFQPGNQLTYQLLEQDNRPSQRFDIQDEDDAQRIVNRMPIDYEITTFASLTIKVTEAVTGLTSTVPINIAIIDANDNAPTFSFAQYTATIREDIPVGASVLTVAAADFDSGPNGEIFFSILNSKSFDVTSNTNNTYFGTVIVKSPLDFDADPRPRQFSVIASDKGIPALSSRVQVTVFLQNVNDNPPTIINTTTNFYLHETSQVNTVITLIQASDIDGDSFQFYFEGKSQTSDIFTIRPSNGQIYLNTAIPKNKNSYTLKVIAVDDDNCCGTIKTGPKTATATLTVNIVDINENKPSFNDCLLYDNTASVKEMSPLGTFVLQVTASDPDRGENGVVLYRIEITPANTDRDVFQININTGEITVKGNISRENYDVIQVTVVGRNPPSFPLMEGRCTFGITIIDINNNPPTFSQAIYTIPLSFSTTPPYIVTQMAASDKDVGVNANITYSFGMDDTVALSTFSIHPLSGVIRLEQNLDQRITSYTLIVVANDNGKDPGPLTGKTTVNVAISFDKRQPPVWLNSAPDNDVYLVSEDSPRGYVITTLACQANSSDTGVEFRVFDAGDTITSDSRMFYIVQFSDNGVWNMNLSLRSPLDYETKTSYTVSIVCQTLSADVLRARLLTRVINVLDANDEQPEFVGLDSNGRYRGTVAENAPAGTVVLQVSASDKDNTPAYKTVSFALYGQFKDFFRVNPLGNNRADIVTTSLLKLDRENVSQYILMIEAQDGAPSSLPGSAYPNSPNKASRFLEVIVTDVNDNPPKFPELSYIFNVSENAPASYVVGVVKAIDPDEIDQGLGLDYRFTRGNEFNAFHVIPITGEIRLAKTLDYENPQEQKVYTLTLIALDSNQLHTATTTVTIFINDENDNRPVFTLNTYRVENKVTEEDRSITPQNPLFLVQVKATDADVGRPNTIRYSLFNPAQSNGNQFFTVDAESGNVSLIGLLDRDIPPYFYTITIEVEDEIVNPLNNFADVLIYPLDVNDNGPEFDPRYLQSSVKDHASNVYVMTISATDKDSGANGTVNYKVAPNQPDPTLASMFELKQSGEIYTTSNVTLLDRETIEFVYLAVVAYDLGTPSRSSTATATISLIDQPPFF